MQPHDFWIRPATLFRYRPRRSVPLARGTVDLLIDCALAAVLPIDRFFIETATGQQLVGREIERAAGDLTRPRRFV